MKFQPIDTHPLLLRRAGCLEFINVKANSERRVSLYLCLSCLSLRWERVSGVVGINVFDYCFNQNIFFFFFPARRRTEGKFLFKTRCVWGGKQKIVGPPTIIPDGKVIFQKESATASKPNENGVKNASLHFFPFFQIFSFSQRNWYCTVWIMGRSDSFCSTFLNFLNLQSRKQTEIAWPKSWKKSPQNKVENEPKLTTPLYLLLHL